MPTIPGARRRRRPRVERPIVEGTIDVEGQRLGFCEFGTPGGRPVFWFHGTPGARRQLAPLAKQHAAANGIRIIGIDRPGVGGSSPRRYDAVIDFAADLEGVADRLGLDRFSVVGLSGGGPYALAAAHRLGDRVAGVGVLGGVAPTVGEDAASGGVTSLAPTFSGSIRRTDALLGRTLRPLLLSMTPVVDLGYLAVYRLMHEGDRRVLDEPGVRDMFIDDLLHGVRRGGVGAILQDVSLFGRDWGFRVGDVAHHVHWWHGTEDAIVPFAHGKHVAALLPRCTFTEQPGEGHLSGYLVADAVLDAVTAEL